ncbi:MAG: nitroreductase [Bacilli bacterium]|nr:nitroreductase [Bacilli bacterium]
MHDFKEAILNRHSVRDYLDTPLNEGQIQELNAFISRINKEYDLDIALCLNEDIFSNWILGYGFIKNCHNYIRFAGKEGKDLEEKIGYYGEMVILKAQELGLNTCWVGGTYRKKDVKEDGSSKLVLVSALGVGKNPGVPSKSKELKSYYEGSNVPEWFVKGMESVVLSPSAVNQKKWLFRYEGGDKVSASSDGKHFNDVDLGIAKLHFELGAQRQVFGFKNFLFEE